MVSRQFHYIKRNVFMPFLLAEILNYQGSAHFIGVGSLSNLIQNTHAFYNYNIKKIPLEYIPHKTTAFPSAIPVGIPTVKLFLSF